MMINHVEMSWRQYQRYLVAKVELESMKTKLQAALEVKAVNVNHRSHY
jgi:hypothetical protein